MTPPDPQHRARSADPPHGGLTMLCPAKVNLALAVGRARDDGYHPIASLMTAVDFGDTLSITALPQEPSQWDIHFADDAPAPQLIDWPLKNDLAWRAHQLVQEHVGKPLPVRVELDKRIPAGAGLGGGSSNAAATLLALNTLFNLNLGQAQLQSLAAGLGSDVVFLVAAMHGANAALVEGLGERITPADRPHALNLVLVLPPLRCPTARVYAAFDEQVDHDRPFDPDIVRQLAQQPSLTDAMLFNDLAEAACHVQPKLADARMQLAKATGRAVHITGSGAAMFLLANSASDASELASDITRHTGLASVPTRTRTA